MKGVVFTEFLEMVEDKFGYNVADRIILESRLHSGGIYTSIDTYEHTELLRLVDRLSGLSGIASPDLLRTFGIHLFHRFTVMYPHFFERIRSAFSFLENVEGYVHVEVWKLYPDAELPRFDFRRLGPGQAEMIYRSPRPLADLAEGLIIGCSEHFDNPVEIRRRPIPGEERTATRFVLVCKEVAVQ